MPRLVLGPLLRYVGTTEATVWVETDEPCEVEVLGHAARTFCVGGHHFALVAVEGLRPGTATPYEVALDGETAWPQASPPPVIRTPDEGASLQLAFGSCRICAPQGTRGLDALRALALRLQGASPETWPDALVMLGDQVYADDVPPETRAFIRGRRDAARPPGEQVADFEEYARLYREAWSEPALRWLLSTVPTVMIFDDHDVHDDWNTSEAWVGQMRAQPWWHERIVGALMAYWCYQHLGNLAPRELAADELLRTVREAGDGTAAVRAHATEADRDPASARWSFRRDLGGVRLVMVDTRAGRVLAPGRRSMLDEAEWRWLEENATGDCDHLLLGSSLPWLLGRGMHELEALSEAVCDGVWGARAARLGERVRQAVDLEHWAAFQGSFRRLCALVGDVAAGRRGRPPATVVALSGDVHHAYLSAVELPDRAPDGARVYQAVCSPFRNPLVAPARWAVRLADSRLFTRAAAALARAAGVDPPPVRWSRVRRSPWFDNQVATLRFEGRAATLRLERVAADGTRLEELLAYDL